MTISTPAIAPAPAASAGTPPLQDPATLAAIKKRTLVLLLVLLPAIVLTVVLVIAERRTMQNGPVAEKAIPETLITPDRVWTSTRMTFSDTEMQILETRDYVFRTYSDDSTEPGSGPVDLCIVFSEDNRKGTHPPDVCLEASGCHIVARPERTINIDGTDLAVREIITTAVGSNDQYLYFAYFYKCGDTFTPSFYKQQVQIVLNGLLRRNTAGALIRYSTPMNKLDDLDLARRRTDQLIRLTFPYLKKNLNAGHAAGETKLR